MPGDELTLAQVHRIARLARLTLTDDQAAHARSDLAGVLGYIDRLSRLDLDGVEPLTHAGGWVNRLDPDELGPTLDPSVVRALAPETFDAFIRVPRVFDAGGGA
ncbi:MAG: Asp-tRNA(Asn)/Glu-tRNA(Gln) amidotransferase subunit GatC [Phycisphaerales bacterium]|nr:Asp-tRNA(Asn)/Glu-tRNA(Gln) amidotransferase subunit GatC [Phycisphaerales bacterium]